MFQHTGHRDPTPCLRHGRVWLASCTGCTAWHLHRQIAARGPAGPHLDHPAAPALRAVA